jgi:hypothetical protein
MKFDNHTSYVKNIVFIDGVSRVGKTALSSIMTIYKKSEVLQFCHPLEHILPAYSLKHISKSFSKSYINTYFNEAIYNTFINRNLNIRKNELTSIYSHHGFKKYKKRLLSTDGESVIKRLKKTKNFFPFMSHDLMVNYFKLIDFKLNFKLIEIYRNPVDTVMSWYNRGWGARFINDSKSWTLSLKYKSKLVPWYSAGYEKEYLKSSELERCVLNVIDLTKRSINNHRKIGKNKKIFVITFEGLLLNTVTTINKLKKFLNSEYIKDHESYLKKARLPRKYDYGKTIRNKNYLKKKINPKLFQKLDKLEKAYIKNTYGIQIN